MPFQSFPYGQAKHQQTAKEDMAPSASADQKATGINAAMPGQSCCQPEASPFPYEHPSPCQRTLVSLLPLDLKYEVKKEKGGMLGDPLTLRELKNNYSSKKKKKGKMTKSVFLGYYFRSETAIRQLNRA